MPGGDVTITTKVREGNTHLPVANTGPVVPKAATERLLQPFQRLYSERTSYGEGLGLGLSIVAAYRQRTGPASIPVPNRAEVSRSRSPSCSPPTSVNGQVEVPAGGQQEVPAGGQVEVPTPRSFTAFLLGGHLLSGGPRASARTLLR